MRKLLLAGAAAIAMLASGITDSKATIYLSLADWNAHADPDISFTAAANLIGFFGACAVLGSGNCQATDNASNTPVADSSNAADTTAFINANASFDVVGTLNTVAVTGGLGVTSGTATTVDPFAVWVIKADNFLIALQFDQGITSLGFNNLHNATSHIDVGTPTSAVPEPATWGMMLLGFIGLGFAFHKRRRITGFAA